jgi:hypothetical protein
VSQGSRTALILAAVAALIGGFILANGSGDDDNGSDATTTTSAATTGATTNTPPVVLVRTINVVDGKPDGGIVSLKFKKGERVRFKVDSDTADEIHVHGYDLMKDVEAGGTVSFSFAGTIDGKFEIELEDHKQQIASLTVEP